MRRFVLGVPGANFKIIAVYNFHPVELLMADSQHRDRRLTLTTLNLRPFKQRDGTFFGSGAPSKNPLNLALC